MRVCVCVCMRTCVRACVRACVWPHTSALSENALRRVHAANIFGGRVTADQNCGAPLSSDHLHLLERERGRERERESGRGGKTWASSEVSEDDLLYYCLTYLYLPLLPLYYCFT